MRILRKLIRDAKEGKLNSLYPFPVQSRGKPSLSTVTEVSRYVFSGTGELGKGGLLRRSSGYESETCNRDVAQDCPSIVLGATWTTSITYHVVRCHLCLT